MKKKSNFAAKSVKYWCVALTILCTFFGNTHAAATNFHLSRNDIMVSSSESANGGQYPNCGQYYFGCYHLEIRNGGTNGTIWQRNISAFPVSFKGVSNGMFNFVWSFIYTDFNAGYPYPLKTIEHPFYVTTDYSKLIDENGNVFKKSSKQTYENVVNETQRILNGGGGTYNQGNSSGNGNSSSGSVVCKYCGGRGTCSSCKGNGYKFNSYSGHNDTCPSCNGNGKCFNCYGSGRQR